MTKRLCLDFDGTVVDCRHRQMAVLHSVTPKSLDIDRHAIWNSKRNGKSTTDALKHAGLTLSQSMLIAMRWEKFIEDRFWLSLDVVFPNVEETLIELKRRDWQLVLITARRDPDALHQQLLHLRIRRLLNSVHVVDPRKAAPAKAEILYREQPMLFVGDNESDGTAAQLAGVPFKAVASGQRCREFMTDHGYSPIYSTLVECIDAVV